MIQEKATVLQNIHISASYYKITLRCSAAFAYAMPGQFVTLDVSNNKDPLLRRPFSIHSIFQSSDAVSVELLYHVIGPGTRHLSAIETGDVIDVLGPLGNSFHLPRIQDKIALVAGGIGVAPIIFLAATIFKTMANRPNCQVFIGGRGKDDVLGLGDIQKFGYGITVTTEDGSLGQKSLITQPLEKYIIDNEPDIIYACGPHGMLKAVAAIAATRNITCQVSIETIMACGMGACLGCAVKGKAHATEGYMHVCKDGPVFNANELKWQENQ